MAKPRAFISFDFDHDQDLRNLLVGQSKNPDSPFELADWSVKAPLTGDWLAQVRSKIRACNVVIVICGQWTHTATGINLELKAAQDAGIPYFLLWGRANADCKKPNAASWNDKVYRWTWDNLKALIAGAR